MTDGASQLESSIEERALHMIPGAALVYRTSPGTGTSAWVFLHRDCHSIYGVDRDELQRSGPQLLSALTHPEDRDRIMASVKRGLTTLEPLHDQFRIVRPDGSTTHVEVDQRFEREDGGNILVFAYVRDVADRVEMQVSLARTQTETVERETLYRAVVDALPIGVAVMRLDGTLPLANEAFRQMVPLSEEERAEVRFEDQDRVLTVRSADGRLLTPAEQPIGRVMGGESLAEAEIIVEIRGRPTRLATSAHALRDPSGGLQSVLSVTRDVTAQRAVEDELQQRNAQLAESENDKSQLIERLRHAVDELANPILEVWDEVLVLPVIGLVDSRRASDMVERLLHAVANGQARHVIIDLTGVEIIDTRTADHLIKLVKKVELVGARCVLVGIRPAVAQTLVDIGVDFGRLTTLRNLKHGLRDALLDARRRGRERERDESDLESDARADAR